MRCAASNLPSRSPTAHAARSWQHCSHGRHAACPRARVLAQDHRATPPAVRRAFRVFLELGGPDERGITLRWYRGTGATVIMRGAGADAAATVLGDSSTAITDGHYSEPDRTVDHGPAQLLERTLRPVDRMRRFSDVKPPRMRMRYWRSSTGQTTTKPSVICRNAEPHRRYGQRRRFRRHSPKSGPTMGRHSTSCLRARITARSCRICGTVRRGRRTMGSRKRYGT